MESRNTTPVVESELPEIPMIEPPASKKKGLDTKCFDRLADALYKSNLRQAVEALRKSLEHATLDSHQQMCEKALEAAKAFNEPEPDGGLAYYGPLSAMIAEMQHCSYGYAVCQEAADVVIAEAQDALDAIAELKKMQEAVECIADRMDPKARAIVGVANELQGLDGYTDVGYGNPLLFERLGGWKKTQGALDASAEDGDIITLRKVFDLIRRIRQVADREQLEAETEEDGESASEAEVAPV